MQIQETPSEKKEEESHSNSEKMTKIPLKNSFQGT